MYNNPYSYYPYMNMAANIPRNAFAFNNGMMGNAMAMNGMGQAIRPTTGALKGGLLKGLSNIKWGDVLNNTQKTLNVINQAIPVYYQVKPIFSNVKSLGRLMSAFNDDSPTPTSNNNSNNNEITKKENSSNSPTFFIN